MPGFFNASALLTVIFLKSDFSWNSTKQSKATIEKYKNTLLKRSGFHAIHNRNGLSNSSKVACYPAFFNEKIHIDFWYKGLPFILPDFAIDPILSLMSVEERRFLDRGDGTLICQNVRDVTASFSTSFMTPCFNSGSGMKCQLKIALLLLFMNRFSVQRLIKLILMSQNV